MDLRELDDLTLKARADAVIEAAARELRPILCELVRRLQPFPCFLNTDIPALEAEPRRYMGGKYSCVVVCPDAELRELSVAFDLPADMMSAMQRREDLADLRLPTIDYVGYAYGGIEAAAQILRERQSMA